MYLKIMRVFVSIAVLVSQLLIPGRSLEVDAVSESPVLALPDGVSTYDVDDYVELSTINITPSLKITSSGDYDGAYIEVTSTSTDTNEILSITSNPNPTAEGAISLSGTSVYLGTGDDKVRIGGIDSVKNGQNGQPLRINITFSRAFTNPSFESGSTGWTITNSLWASQSSLDGVSIPINPVESCGENTSATVMVASNPTGTSFTGTIANSTNPVPSQGSYLVKLTSSGSVPGTDPVNCTGAYSIFGPSIMSDEFSAYTGDSFTVDWQAYAGGDWYDVFGFLISAGADNIWGNADDTRVTMFSERGDETSSWRTAEITIPEDRLYKFEFVSGSYDASGGTVLGASLYVDNVVLEAGSTVNVTNENIQTILQQLSYTNTSKNPQVDRTLSVTFTSSSITSNSIDLDVHIPYYNHGPEVTTTTSEQLNTGGSTSYFTLFSNTQFTTYEPDQKITEIGIILDGIRDGVEEFIQLDGEDIAISLGSGSTIANGYNYVISANGSNNYLLTIMDANGYENTPLNTLIDNLKYKNTSLSQTVGSRIFTIDTITDNGVSPGENVSTNLSISSSVNPASHTVAFESNGGSSVSNQVIFEASLVTQPTDPTKTDLYFGGWYSDEELTTSYDFSTPMGVSDFTLYAKWVNATDVNFYSNGGSSVSAQLVPMGQKISEPSKPSYTGYTFAGWYLDSGLSQIYDFNTLVDTTESISLYAKWNLASYAITYDYAGGSGSNPSSYTMNDSIIFSAPTREGYRFDGWTLNGEVAYGITAGSTGSRTFVAQWVFVPRIPVLGDLSLNSLSAEGGNFSLNISDYGNPAINQILYEITDIETGEVITGSTNMSLSFNVAGLQTYSNYSISITVKNGVHTLTSNSVNFKPQLSDSDDDGVPDVRDAYPDDPSLSMDVTQVQPDVTPRRTFVGEVQDDNPDQYGIQITQKDLMGLNASDNILVVMGSVQFVIPVTMVDTIISNTNEDGAYLTLKVQPQIIEAEAEINEELLSSEDMEVVAAYDYLLFQVWSDGREEPVHELGGKIKVGIGLNQLDGEYDPNNMEVYFYNTDDGTIQAMKAVYDPVNQSMVFLTEHFSYYVLGVKKEDDPASATLKVLFLGIAIGIAIVSVIFYLFKRRKDKEEDKLEGSY